MVLIRLLLFGLCTVLLGNHLSAAIGDNAPPVPGTYKAAHPRLPAPDSAFLSSLAANPAALARYNAAADAWDSKSPGNVSNTRRLVIAYLANKAANPVKAATYLDKIKALTDLGGTWGPLLYSVNDGVGNGTYTLTSPTANFLTGCGGKSCQGNILSIQARTYMIVSVPSATSVVLNQSNPAPSGTGLKVRIFSDMGFAGLNIALIYDWLYNDLDTATRTEFMNQLAVLCTEWEENYVGLGASPYNDVFYIRLGTFGLIGALAIYPDHPDGLTHLRFMTDVWFNILLPVWNQVFGPEGGGWHEGWTDYVNAANGAGLTTVLVPSLLSWQSASGDPIFMREAWLKNFAYFTMYMARPDYILESIGDSSRPYLNSEYDLRIGAGLGSLNGLAEIYNDPVLRGWARLVNTESASGPDGFEPSAWPFYTPDKNTNPVASRAALPPLRNFTGWGLLTMRSGWSEDDTSATLKYGDNFWSHEHFDAGSFTIFSRGALAVDSGSYRAGSASKHQNQYARQTIAHNSLTITDPADVYPTTFYTIDEAGSSIQLAPPNEGGQRRAGTGYNERFPQFVSPNVVGDWLKNFDYYHMGKMVAFAPASKYTYTAVDITAAYNNKFSATTPNATNRTNRVQKAVRHMLFIPRGTSAYVVVFDQVTSTNASFVKRWLLHTVNRPTVNGSTFTVTRSELVNELPYNWTIARANELKHCPNNNCSTGNQYQYAGKLYGWMVQPQAANINVIGGPGKEFWVEDPKNPGTGTNWNQCMLGQCAANVEGFGAVEDFINPDPNTAPHEPGSWRLEEQPAAAAIDDFFLNVMLATTVSDTSVPANVTVPAGLAAGNVGAAWTDGGTTYTVTFPKDGLGGHITISGVVDEDLLSKAQRLPDQVQLVSGSGQSAPAYSALPAPLVVAVKDSAGNAVPNAVVHFGVSGGNARFSSATATTDAQGQASVTMITGAGAIGSAITVLAAVNGLPPVQFNAAIAGSSGPTLSSLGCTPASLSSGASATCTLGLSQAAGSSGVTVALSSSAPAITVPANVSVPAGATNTTFTATAGTISATQSVTVTATFNGSTQTASLSLAPAASVVLSSVSCTPTNLSSGGSATCTVTLSQGAGSSGVTVTLASNTQALTVPVSVSIPATSASGTFTAIAGTVSSNQSATVTATFAGASQSASVTLSAPSQGGTGGIPIPLNSWIMAPTRGFPVQSVGFEKLVYAPDPVKKAVFLGNYHMFGSEPNQSLIAYDFESNRWDVFDIGNSAHTENMPEAGHPVGSFTYDPSRKAFIYYCCASGANQPENLFYTWWYDAVGQTGRNKQTSPKPGATMQQGAVFDPFNDTLVWHGGGSFLGTWTYNPKTNTYKQQTTSGTAPDPSTNLPGMTYNTTDHKVYLFGGQIGASFSNDIFAYDVPTNTWTKFTPSGPRPSPRWRSGFAYDSTNNVFLIYGGQDASVVYNDTWIYDPAANAWTQLSPVQSPAAGAVATFETLAYDSDHNVFILVVGGQGGYEGGKAVSYGIQTWLFRYQGTGPNAGTVQPNTQPSAGGFNKNTDAWAKEPSLAAAGDTLYTAWVETGKPFDVSDATWFHVYANQRRNGSWVPMGGAPTSLDSEFNSSTESHSPAVAIIAGTPWISWYKWNNSGQVNTNWRIWAKSWNGSAWQGGIVGTQGSDPVRAYQTRSQMADVGGVPYIAFLEVDRTYYPQRAFAYVKYWDGTQWVLKGNGPLNINVSANTTAASISIASDGTNPYVAWTEYTSDNLVKQQTPAQVHVATWNGSQWVQVGGSLNVSAANWADDVSISFAGGQPYAAWTERTVSGNNQVFVKTFSGGNWMLAGPGSLNKDTTTGWAFRPSLVADASTGSLYLGWVEQQTLGQRAQTYVSRFSAGTWTALGGTLNADPVSGSAQRVNLAIVSGQPVAAWGEVKFGALRQVYAKQWNGSTWTFLNGGASPQPSCDLNGDGVVNVSDVQSAINQVLGVASCTTADLLQRGQCDVIDVQRVIKASMGSGCVVGP